MGSWRLLVVVLAGCGRIGFDATGPDGGDSPDAPDAMAPPATGPFSTPTNVAELNQGSINSEDPSLTDDLLEIVFSSTRPGGAGGVDVWTATRASPGAAWGAPVLVPGINSANDDTTPDLSGDGLVLMFASNRPGGAGLYDLYRATRASRDAAWSAPVRIVELASDADEFAGATTADRLRLVFASARAGGVGGGDLYEAERTSAEGAWSTPLTISIDSTADDSAPWLAGDGRTLYFGSDRAGGQGQQDVWMATRATPTAPWTTPAPVTELNGTENDSDPWLSPDQRTLFYSRQVGSMRSIYTATR